jgi:hypothetical protein
LFYCACCYCSCCSCCGGETVQIRESQISPSVILVSRNTAEPRAPRL